MNRNIEHLYQIASKSERTIIGLMSGTSLDGLDIALCRVSGAGVATKINLEHFTTIDYGNDVKQRIRSVFAKPTVDLPLLAMLNGWIGELHASMVLSALATWQLSPSDVDLIASHGQTVMHAPRSQHNRMDYGDATLQIGDGDQIAVKTGVLTLSDFRQKHIAAGGEGAPLAVYGDYFILGSPDENRILVNLGGIANFTYLPASMDSGRVFVSDTGPGNTLLDAYVREHFPGKHFDRDAAIASAGIASPGLLAALIDHPFFRLPFPRTTGPELFNLAYVRSAIDVSGTQHLSHEDVMATLTMFSARTVVDSIKSANEGANFSIYLSGGGMHNPLLVAMLEEGLQAQLRTTDELGVPGDAKEAMLFAVLANEAICGNGVDFGTRKGVPSVSMGKISLPT